MPETFRRRSPQTTVGSGNSTNWYRWQDNENPLDVTSFRLKGFENLAKFHGHNLSFKELFKLANASSPLVHHAAFDITPLSPRRATTYRVVE